MQHGIGSTKIRAHAALGGVEPALDLVKDFGALVIEVRAIAWPDARCPLYVGLRVNSHGSKLISPEIVGSSSFSHASSKRWGSTRCRSSMRREWAA